MASKIAIQRATGDLQSIQGALRQVLGDIRASELLAGKQKILLKPNLLNTKSPEKAGTTSPVLLGAVLDWLLSQGVSRECIVVGESSGGSASTLTKRAFRTSGIQEICESRGVRFTPFEGTKLVEVPIPGGQMLQSINISEELAGADLVINLPKIKTHGQMVATLSIKNMFGSLVLNNKARMHATFPILSDFAVALVDIYSAIRPQLTIMDGITAMEGRGPGNGDVVELGIILAGRDPVAMDAVCVEIMGLEQELVLTTQVAADRGLGTNDLTQIEVVGVPISELRRKFKFPTNNHIMKILFNTRLRGMTTYFMRNFTRTRVWFDKKVCTKCGECVRSCPVEALEFVSKESPPVWAREKCIACHCCEELCPVGAARVGTAGIRGVWPAVVAIAGMLALFVAIIILWCT